MWTEEECKNGLWNDPWKPLLHITNYRIKFYLLLFQIYLHPAKIRLTSFKNVCNQQERSYLMLLAFKFYFSFIFFFPFFLEKEVNLTLFQDHLKISSFHILTGFENFSDANWHFYIVRGKVIASEVKEGHL